VSFAWLSPWIVAGGVLALAGTLYLLHRLRVRYRTVRVVTSLFWRQAVEESRARVLVKRFRHPWTYALLLGLTLLLWLAAAGLQLGARGDRRIVLILDGSATALEGDRFASSVRALKDAAASAPRPRTQVVWSGARTQTLLKEGEDLALLESRLAGLMPELCPPTVERTLETLLQERSATGGLDVEIFGMAPIRKDRAAQIPEGVALWRNENSPRSANRGITALGVREAVSGAWDRVDAQFEGATAGGAVLKTEELKVTLDGSPLEGWTAQNGPSGLRVTLPDLAANGQLLEVRIAGGDAFTADDQAALRLPRRDRIRVALGARVAPVVAAVLRADPGVTLTEETPQVFVRATSESARPGIPELVLAEDSAGAAFEVGSPAGEEAERTLRSAFDELGLEEIDGTELADAAGRAIEVRLESAPVRSLKIWNELLSSRYNFVRGRAFPAFVARGIRWLASIRPVEPSLAAGRILRDGDAELAAPELPRLAAIGGSLRVPRAGTWTAKDGSPQISSLLSREASCGLPETEAAELKPMPSGASFDPTPWLALAALALLCVEWQLLRRERIP